MSNEDLKKWDDLALDWLGNSEVQQFRNFLITPTLLRLLGEVKGKKVLDAGCGDGVFASLITRLGARVIGVDGSVNMIAEAKRKYPDIEFITLDLLRPSSFNQGSFDVIIANLLLTSLSDPSVFLSEALKILKKQGVLVVSVLHPCFNFPTTRLYKSFWMKLDQKPPLGLMSSYFNYDLNNRYESGIKNNLPFYHHTLEDYAKLFKEHGFEIDEVAEPHELPKEFLLQHPKFEYATRLPRFLFFKLAKRA